MRRPQNGFWTFNNPKNSPLGPQKVKNDPRIKSKSNVRFERNKEDESCSNTWVDHKTVFEPYPNPRIAHLGPKKMNNDPEIKTKSKARIEENIENKSWSTTWLDYKTVFEPYPDQS